MEIFASLESLEPLLQTFWCIALPTSVIFIIQAILTFLNADSTDILEAETGMSVQATGETPFQLFSLRNLINFLLGFSWTGISLYGVLENKALLVALSLCVGTGFVYMFFAIIRQVQKLAEDNSFHISSALNKTAEVYLTIPQERSGKGKVLVSVNGSVHELPAITEEETIPTGAIVTIVRVQDDSVVVARREEY